MVSEKEKMLQGKIYDPSDDELAALRKKAHKLSRLYNQLDEDDPERERLLKDLIPNMGQGVYLQGPIQFDYGCNTTMGDDVFANFNLTVLDVCPVKIGSSTYFGPNVSIMTPIHPLLGEERKIFINAKGNRTDMEYAKPIVIGSNCWIATGVIICGGVTIGDNVVIGAGAVVTHDIPDGVLAAGIPCKVIRKLTEEDSIYKNKNLW